ncbi:MAG: respiratory nitrate reductase subunit gamma [Turicimonas muris]
MNDLYLTLNFVIFQVMPYAILAILLLGSFVRYLISPFSWKSQSSELIDKKDLMWGANLFHIGVIIVFFGHVFGLFTPSAILDMMGMTPAVHQLVAVFVGGTFAVVAVLGIFILFFRRCFNDRVRTASRPSDYLVLILLIAVLLFGCASVIESYLYDHSGATIVLFRSWVHGLLTFDPNAWTYMLQVPEPQKWHIFIGLLVFLVVPFTRLAHIWSGYFTPLFLIRPHQIMRINRKPMK